MGGDDPGDVPARVRAIEAHLRERDQVALARTSRLEAEVARLDRRLAWLEHAGSEFRRALTRLGDALAATHDRPAMVSAVLETTVLLFGAETGVFYEIVAGSDRLRAMATYGAADPPADLVRGEGVAGTAALHEGVVVTGPGADPPRRSPAEPRPPAPEARESPPAPEAGESPPAREAGMSPNAGGTAVAVPVRSGGHPFGILALYDLADDRRFSGADVETLQTLVRQFETAIDNSYLYDEAKHLSLTDGLTGLWNGRHFELHLSEELSRAMRFADEHFALVLADLDDFKGVNDAFGHQVGNGVLVELARRMMESTREVDLVARLSGGGDEFGLILPRTGLAGALRLAEKVRHAAAARPFTVDGVHLPLTMSLGVAAYPEHGTSEKELKAAADGALYRAKRLGGDRVEHAKFGESPRLDPATAADEEERSS